jgi:hypothetical protein
VVASQPHYLLEQMEKCVAVMREYADSHGNVPGEQLVQEMLDCDKAQNSHRPGDASGRTLSVRQPPQAVQTDGTTAIS